VALEYFTLAEIRALPDVTEGGYSDAVIEAANAHFVSIVEREVGTSFISRTVTDEVHDGGVYEIILKKRFVLSVTSATENGTAVTDTLSVSSNGLLQRFATGSYTPKVWLSGSRNIRVTYSAGYSATCPADLKSAVMWATRDRLITQGSQNGIDVRRTSVTNDLGGTTQFLLPGEKRPTGYPELDALIASYQRSTSPLGIA
jgi:hypothetical protein